MIVESEELVVEAVCEARATRRTLEIVSGGTRRSVGRPVACDEILDVSRISGIVSYEPEELILTVRPGTPLAEIEALLAAKGQRLGFEPADWSSMLGNEGTATIGGAVSSDANGPAAMRFGRARDHLLGFRAVNGFGEAYKGGGKVVKNVTGFDLPKLMCGAFGTLGVLTELTFRVFPKPAASKVFAIGGVTPEEGLSLLRKVWSSPLEATGLALLSNGAWQDAAEIGATEDERFVAEDDEEYGPVNDCAALFRIEGALAEKEALLRAILESFRPMEVEGGERIFRAIGSGALLTRAPLDLWLLTVPPTTCADIVARTANHSRWIADWAGGRIWEEGTPGYDGGWLRKAAASGMATLIRASAETRKRAQVFPPEAPERAALTRAVKAAFDPLGLFNPGRMYKDI